MKNIFQASLMTLIQIILFTIIVIQVPILFKSSPLLAIIILSMYLIALFLPLIQNPQNTWTSILIRRHVIRLNGKSAKIWNTVIRYLALFILYGIPILLNNMALSTLIFLMSLLYAIVTKTYLFEDLISQTRIGRIKDET